LKESGCQICHFLYLDETCTHGQILKGSTQRITSRVLLEEEGLNIFQILVRDLF